MSVPQIVCQVCHTQQPNAWDCAVCGSALHDKPRHWAVPVEKVEGLEPTRQDEGGNVALERMPGLELTSMDDGVEPLPDVVEGLELTSFDAADVQVAPEVVPAFEPTALETDAMPTPAAGAVSCRYCNTPWRPGSSVFCVRCGMRVAAKAAAASADPATIGTTCRACGMPEQAAGSLCKSCQQPVIA